MRGRMYVRTYVYVWAGGAGSYLPACRSREEVEVTHRRETRIISYDRARGLCRPSAD